MSEHLIASPRTTGRFSRYVSYLFDRRCRAKLRSLVVFCPSPYIATPVSTLSAFHVHANQLSCRNNRISFRTPRCVPRHLIFARASCKRVQQYDDRVTRRCVVRLCFGVWVSYPVFVSTVSSNSVPAAARPIRFASRRSQFAALSLPRLCFHPLAPPMSCVGRPPRHGRCSCRHGRLPSPSVVSPTCLSVVPTRPSFVPVSQSVPVASCPEFRTVVLCVYISAGCFLYFFLALRA